MDCKTQKSICGTLYVSIACFCVYISALWSLQCLFWFECTFLYWYKQGIGNAKNCNLECGCLKCIRSWSIKSPFSSPKHIWYVRCTQVMFTSLLLIYVKYVLYISTQLYFQHTADSTNVLGLYLSSWNDVLQTVIKKVLVFIWQLLCFSKVQFKSELLESSESVLTWCPYELVLNLWPVPSE